MTENNFERSSIVKQIITRQPGFIEKWALWMILALLILIFYSSSFIKYPTIVKVAGTIDTVVSLSTPSSLIKITISESYLEKINKNQKIQLELYKSKNTKIYIDGYIQNFSRSKNKVIINIITNKSPVIGKNLNVDISIISKKFTVMQTFWRTVTNGIKL